MRLRWVAWGQSERVEGVLVVVDDSRANALTTSGEMGRSGVNMALPGDKVKRHEQNIELRRHERITRASILIGAC
jgi:hypothetical protein